MNEGGNGPPPSVLIKKLTQDSNSKNETKLPLKRFMTVNMAGKSKPENKLTLNSINEAIKLENEEEDLFPAKDLNNLKMPQSHQQLEDDKRSSADFYSNHSSSVNE